MFAIKTSQKYHGNHDDLLEFAYKEKSDDVRPELATHIDDFSGKTIIPFVTHGGSGFSDTIRTIQRLEPKATVLEDGLSVKK